MKDFLDIDEQIEQNKEVLNFYYSNYQKTQAKISVLVLIYSLIAIYILQVIKYPFETFQVNSSNISAIYIVLLTGLAISMVISIRYTYLLLKPIDVAYIHYPKFYYDKIKNDYIEALQIDDEEILNVYIKHTYLNELEEAVRHNSYLFKIKSKYYDFAFKTGLISIILYILCSGFVIFKGDKPNDINIKNYKEIIEKIDSLSVNHQNMTLMTEKKKSSKQDSGKVKIDPSKVIKTKPRMIRENFSQTEKRTTTKPLEKRKTGE